MANRCYMVGWDPAKGAPLAPSIELNYDVPLFCLAMFDVADLHDITVDGDAFVKPPGAGPDFKIQTYLWSPGEIAIERLARRIPALASATNKLPLAEKFQKFIAKYAERSFLLQVSELAWMMEGGEYARLLREQM